MTSFATDPWGKRALAPRFTDQSRPSRRSGFASAGVPAPGEASPSRPSSGAGFSILTVALPDPVLLLLRLAGAHEGVEDDGEMIARLVAARAKEIGIAGLADAATHTCESEEGRPGVPLGVRPQPPP